MEDAASHGSAEYAKQVIVDDGHFEILDQVVAIAHDVERRLIGKIRSRRHDGAVGVHELGKPFIRTRCELVGRSPFFEEGGDVVGALRQGLIDARRQRVSLQHDEDRSGNDQQRRNRDHGYQRDTEADAAWTHEAAQPPSEASR